MNKKEIEHAIEQGNYSEAEGCIADYEKENPYDIEIFSYRISVLLGQGKLDSAYREAKKALKLNPLCIESNYNMAVAAEAAGELVEAWSYYIKANQLQIIYGETLIDEDILQQQYENVYMKIYGDDRLTEAFDSVNCLNRYMFADPFKNYDKAVVGTIIQDSTGQSYYAGRCDGWYEAYWDCGANRDACRAKCEFFPIAHIGNSFRADANMLLPVVMNPDIENKEQGNGIMDSRDPEQQSYFESAVAKYSYIPTSGTQEFAALREAVWGRPIPLHSSDKRRKKLVLNLFVDSFNRTVIEKYGLEKLMPCTAKFFGKGADFSNYYSTSEWTLPTIATYWTGKRPSTHMNIMNEYRHNFMGDDTVFPELFKKAGYVTAKIGGNDSVTPAQGYIRGFDRFVFQLNAEGQTVKEVVADTLEHMRTFADTDQFLWLDIVDLHHIAGNFMRSLEVQAKSPLASRKRDNEQQSTIKQTHSDTKEILFCNELHKIDFFLSLLYNYIEETYSDDEIVVSLFSDHGTAFIVEDGQPFMSDQRVRVPLLIRGGGLCGEIDEIIEVTDYAGMICSLAGVPYSYDDKDARLPKCLGGGEEREYALSQSIFMGDPYQAAFHTKNNHFYVQTRNKTGRQFKIDLSDIEMWTVDSQGKRVKSAEKQEEYLAILKKTIGHLLKYD